MDDTFEGEIHKHRENSIPSPSGSQEVPKDAQGWQNEAKVIPEGAKMEPKGTVADILVICLYI